MNTLSVSAQANPVLGKTLVCGTLRTAFAANGDVTFNRPVDGKRGGKLKVVQNPSFKTIKDLQVVDAQGKFILHFQQMNNGRYEMEGDRCTLAK
ncbi:MAG: hypothetical protein ACRCUX_06955 [Beijerinckiaceae bacterium]